MSAERLGERGFLLLEALIGLAIIGIVAIALLGATSAQVRSASKATAQLTAGALAQDRIAALHLLNHDGLSDPPDSLVTGVFPPPFQAFSWIATVTATEDEYDLFTVRVAVTGEGEVFALETLVHRAAPTLVAADGGGQR